MVGEGITPVDPAAKIRPDKSLVTANHAWLEVVRVPFVPESSAVGDAKVCGDFVRKRITIMEAENPCSKAWESRTTKASRACRGAFSFFFLMCS